MGNINIVESNAAIQKRINAAVAKMANKRLTKAVRGIKSQLGPLVQGALMTSPEISSLSNGILRAEFGLEFDPSSQIIGAVVGSLDVHLKKIDRNLNGGLTIVMQPSDFSNLLSLSVAEQPIRGGSIPWLSWLLKAGDSIIIADFGVEYGGHGRTGKARMSKNFAPYKVNSAFSGTKDNNFITRAIARVAPQILDLLRREL
jgi:hypothetical protein